MNFFYSQFEVRQSASFLHFFFFNHGNLVTFLELPWYPFKLEMWLKLKLYPSESTLVVLYFSLCVFYKVKVTFQPKVFKIFVPIVTTAQSSLKQYPLITSDRLAKTYLEGFWCLWHSAGGRSSRFLLLFWLFTVQLPVMVEQMWTCCQDGDLCIVDSSLRKISTDESSEI